MKRDKNSKGVERENEAFDVASETLSAIHNFLTNYNLFCQNNYINVSTFYNLGAGGAPEALSVMQRPDEPCPDGLPGSTPGWGDSVPYNDLFTGNLSLSKGVERENEA